MARDYLTKAEAEEKAGIKLDGRYKYFLWDNEVCISQRWTQPCSGCSCDGEYPCSCCNIKGGGCYECGYTGKVRMSFPCPVKIAFSK